VPRPRPLSIQPVQKLGYTLYNTSDIQADRIGNELQYEILIAFA